jgi:hypothetical protein
MSGAKRLERETDHLSPSSADAEMHEAVCYFISRRVMLSTEECSVTC